MSQLILFVLSNRNIFKNKFYTPAQPLIFKNHLCPVVRNSNKSFSRLSEISLSVIAGASFYNSFFYIVKFKFVKSFLWLGAFLYSSKMLMGVAFNKRFFINDISLYDCGTKIKLKTQSNMIKEIDIKMIRSLNKNENNYYNSLPAIANKFYPIVIDDRIFLLRNSITVVNKEVMTAILNGKYIKVKRRKVEKENIVNL